MSIPTRRPCTCPSPKSCSTRRINASGQRRRREVLNEQCWSSAFRFFRRPAQGSKRTPARLRAKLLGCAQDLLDLRSDLVPTADYPAHPLRFIFRAGSGVLEHDPKRTREQVRTRNQRLAALRTFYRYLAVHHPEMLAEAERVEAIPTKRTPPPETRYLERDEIDKLFQSLPKRGPLVLRDRALLMLLYNTGARVQEVADLRVADVAWRARYACGSTVKETSGEAVPFGQRPCMH